MAGAPMYLLGVTKMGTHRDSAEWSVDYSARNAFCFIGSGAPILEWDGGHDPLPKFGVERTLIRMAPKVFAFYVHLCLCYTVI